MTPIELRRRRSAAQLLAGSERYGPADVVRHLLAVQAQDLRRARLALRARSTGLNIAEIDAALTAGILIVSWLLRGTLHLVHRDDYPTLWALTAPTTQATNRRRLAEEGVAPPDADRAVAVIEQALSGGPLRRDELVPHVADAGVRTEGQAMPHILMLAALRGRVVLGPIRGGRPAFARTEPPPELTCERRAAALGNLVRRYLQGHGPASVADVAAWSGLGRRDVQSGLDRLGGALDENDDLVDLSGRATPPEVLPARLLPAFDAYLLGWRDRSFAVPDAYRRRVYPGGGMVRAVATVDGVAVGTWTLRRGTAPVVGVEPFERLDRASQAALDAEAEDVARFETT